MSNENQAPLDIDNMSDEEVSALDPSQFDQLMEQEAEEDVPESEVEEVIVEDIPSEETEDDDLPEDDENDIDTVDDDKSDDDEVTEETSGSDDEPDEDDEVLAEDPKGDSKPSKDVPKEKNQPKEKQDTEEESVKEKESKSDDKSEVSVDDKSAFYDKITAPFKADGKDITIKNAEDAIRLMQMGTNYSKRMQELKPMRALNDMLETHGLNDPAKLGFLIDIQAGKPEAIQKLLKDHNIDPLDIDTSKDTGYVAPDYSPDEKVTNFKEAIKETMTKEGGRDLIQEITNADGLWDEDSKEALKETPEIFDNLLDQRKSGVYTKITEELTYQKALGYLTNVPFLQAYHAVGQAMDKAGVFKTDTKDASTSTSDKPIDTGPRKATKKKPAPNLSSIQQPRTTKVVKTEEIKDYATMSDEEFMKLSAPA